MTTIAIVTYIHCMAHHRGDVEPTTDREEEGSFSSSSSSHFLLPAKIPDAGHLTVEPVVLLRLLVIAAAMLDRFLFLANGNTQKLGLPHLPHCPLTPFRFQVTTRKIILL